MRTITYKPGTQSGPFSRSEWESFLRMMRVDVPDFEVDDDYTRLIEKNNGGEPAARYFLVDGNWHEVERLLNFADARSANEEDLLFHVNQTWNLIEDRLRPGMFPFASLPGGNFLIMDCRHTRNGPVTFWYHELSAQDAPYLLPVAENFAAFIEGLQHAPADDGFPA